MLVIKDATVADIAIIREITKQTWPQTYVPIIGAEQVAYMLALFYNNEALEEQIEELHHHFILCFRDEQPVGFASFSEIEQQVFKLHKLYVLPSEQGKGTGRALTGHITTAVLKEGGRELRLNVNRYNHSAKSFYEKAGFRHLLDEDISIGNGYFMNDHVLVLDIQQK